MTPEQLIQEALTELGHNKIKIGDDTYNVYQTTKEKEGLPK